MGGGWTLQRHLPAQTPWQSPHNTGCFRLGSPSSEDPFYQRKTNSDLRCTCFWVPRVLHTCDLMGAPHLCPGRKWLHFPPTNVL